MDEQHYCMDWASVNGILRKTEERSEWRAVIWRVVNPRIKED